ncbi:zincin [Atractiella rhizophila]|nr:zincin [Atractiella rhizophila]
MGISSRKCGPTSQWTDENVERGEALFQGKLSTHTKTLDQYRSKAASLLNSTNNTASDGKIDVYWHVIYESKNEAGGYLTDEKIQENVDVMNQGYKGTGIQFELMGVTKTKNDKWFNRVGPEEPELAYATAMKKRLRVGGPEVLNVYTVGFKTGSGEGLLGYATFPMDYDTAPQDDGVVIAYNSVPGGSATKFDQGKTLTHEVGHWLGLFHVFSDQGVCTGPQDYVNDTPDQKSPTSGCPTVAADSCPGAGVDSIHNFMDYSYDECLTEFTPGQVARALATIEMYRGIVLPEDAH